MIKIITEQGVEISERDVNTDVGHLVFKRNLIRHHEAIPKQLEQTEEVPFLIFEKKGGVGIPVEEFHGNLDEAYGIEYRSKILVEGSEETEAWDEFEEVYVYTMYTPEELISMEIANIKNYLTATDYIGARIIEGSNTKEHYNDIIQERELKRIRLRDLLNTKERL